MQPSARFSGTSYLKETDILSFEVFNCVPQMPVSRSTVEIWGNLANGFRVLTVGRFGNFDDNISADAERRAVPLRRLFLVSAEETDRYNKCPAQLRQRR